jgi:formylglycine-generating enzyme required for sulfatase activity
MTTTGKKGRSSYLAPGAVVLLLHASGWLLLGNGSPGPDRADGNLVPRAEPPTPTSPGKTAPARAAAPLDAAQAMQLQKAWAEYLGLPVVREADLGGGVTMKLTLIPPGMFLMGSPDGEAGHDPNEEPQHPVEITSPFYLGVCPVTKGQFAAFAQAEPYETEAETDSDGSWGYNAATRKYEGPNRKYTWKNPGWEQTDVHPVVNVTWHDAGKFCTWLSKKEGRTYELPTEAEWAYGCRAGTTTRFWCGNDDASLKGHANIADASFKAKCPDAGWAVSWNDGYPFTSPVGMFRANPWGLDDMHGNVWQWCADRHGPYHKGSVKDPKGAESGERRVMRGGSWDGEPRHRRSANRYVVVAGNRGGANGFRVLWRVPAGTL